MDTIHASTLKGYCSLPLCYWYLTDVSAQLDTLHKNGRAHGNVSLKHVAVDGHTFVLTDVRETADASPASDIWNLAASAFELMLGTPILNGAGESAQTPHTPIPSLPQADAEPLNELLHRCLHHNPAERPTASEVHILAQEAMIRKGQPKRAPRIHTSAQAQETLEKADRQWPERMLTSVAKQATLLLILLMSALFSFAQVTLNETDEQVTKKLMGAVLMLHKGDARSWNSAQEELGKRITLFTLMDELRDDAHDCPLVSGQVRSCGVNRMVSELKRGHRVQNSGRELLDGADARFNYSLYEKGIKKGSTATYTMTGRSGRQVFLVIPYSAKQAYSVELSRQNGTVISPAGKDINGVTYYIIDSANGPVPGETITLKITNSDPDNHASFVIINHNYRDKK